MKTLGRKEDLGWAVLTAAATTLVVKLAEWAIESAKNAIASRRDDSRAIASRQSASQGEKEQNQ